MDYTRQVQQLSESFSGLALSEVGSPSAPLSPHSSHLHARPTNVPKQESSGPTTKLDSAGIDESNRDNIKNINVNYNRTYIYYM